MVGGLTRPPMMLGVPFTLFVLEFCVVVLIFINTKNLLMFLLLIPVHSDRLCADRPRQQVHRHHPRAVLEMSGDTKSSVLGRRFLQALRGPFLANLARHIFQSVSFGGVDAREATIAKHVPYLRHVAEDMIKTKEGHFLMVVKVGGYCFQTADQAEIDMRLSGRNTLIRAMNDSRFAIYSHIVRREVASDDRRSFRQLLLR